MKFYALYSKKAVAEFKEGRKTKQKGKWIEKTGILHLRFANLESGENHKEILSQMSPVECFSFYRAVKKVIKNGGTVRVFIHKVDDRDAKELVVEKWKNGKGYSIILTEGKSRINVGTSAEEILALAEWMKYLNNELRIRELIKVEEGEEEEPAGEPAGEPVPEPDDDDDDYDIDL